MTRDLKTKPPLWVRYFPSAILEATTLMDEATELTYRRLIDLIYMTGDNLPDDDRRLAELTKAGKRWKRIKSTLISLGKVRVERGFLRQDKCSLEIQKARSFSERQGERRRGAGKSSQTTRQNSPKPLANKETRKSTVPSADVSPDTSPDTSTEQSAVPSTDISAAPTTRARQAESCKKESAVANTENNPPRALVAEPPHAAADADRIFRETGTKVLDLIGDPGTLNFARVRRWLESGADPELDILPAVRQVIARERLRDPNWRPRGLTYFDGAIREWMDMRLRPLTGQRNGAATAPAPADPPPGTYLGRPTPLPEGHPARKEHAHLSAYLDPKTRGLWAQTWNGIWRNRDEPRDEAEARARLAELEPIIWPDTAGAPKAPAAEPAPVVDMARAAPAEAQDARDGVARYHPSGRVRDGHSRAAAGGNSQSRKQEA